jgi:hypothetical protein
MSGDVERRTDRLEGQIGTSRGPWCACEGGKRVVYVRDGEAEPDAPEVCPRCGRLMRTTYVRTRTVGGASGG